jgi:hypothetical protein
MSCIQSATAQTYGIINAYNYMYIYPVYRIIKHRVDYLKNMGKRYRNTSLKVNYSDMKREHLQEPSVKKEGGLSYPTRERCS